LSTTNASYFCGLGVPGKNHPRIAAAITIDTPSVMAACRIGSYLLSIDVPKEFRGAMVSP
jgi:hypothetical protein